MGSKLQSGGRLRPVDLARGHGLSTQAVRNYEEAGILPAAARSAHGYRRYTVLHAAALRAFLALVPGHGHGAAAEIMRAVNRGAVEEAFALIDAGHVQLLEDRRTLRAVEAALRDLGAGPGPNPGPGPGPGPGFRDGGRGAGGVFIGPLAGGLGVRPATLRAWERAGLVSPGREARTGYRVYDEADVRDVRLVHQLRRGGYPLAQIAPLIGQVRAAGGLEPLGAALGDWHGRLTVRGRALLAGAAELEAYLRERG